SGGLGFRLETELYHWPRPAPFCATRHPLFSPGRIAMNPSANSFSITDECRNCGQHLPAHVAMTAAECPVCHSGDLVEVLTADTKALDAAPNQMPCCMEYTVVFRMEGDCSRRSFMEKLTETFADHEVEILEIQAGNKLSGSEEQ
ncbi:Uncharacterized protein ALO83_02332, partial [Pseudomonas cannabina pv. alisalensis]